MTASGSKDANEAATPEFFNLLFRSHYQKVFHLFLRWTKSPESAGDLAQETFLRAFRAIGDFRRETGEGLWLFEIASNVFKNHLRDKRAKKRDALEISMVGTEGNENPDLIPDLVDTAAPALERLIDLENKSRFRDAIARLPSQRRQAVELRLQGRQYLEIAQLMGISIETVKSHLHQALESLRRIMGNDGSLEDGTRSSTGTPIGEPPVIRKEDGRMSERQTKALELYKVHRSMRKVASELGLSAMAVSKILKKVPAAEKEQAGVAIRKPGGGSSREGPE